MKKHGVACAINIDDYDQNVIDVAAMMALQHNVDLDLLPVALFPNASHVSGHNYVEENSGSNFERKRT